MSNTAVQNGIIEPQEYVDISEFKDTETPKDSSELDARKSYVQENLDHAIAHANKAAGLLLNQAPDKALAIARDSLNGYREDLANAYRSPSTSVEDKSRILEEIKITDIILGSGKEQVQELQDSLAKMEGYLGELQELYQEETDRISDAMKSASDNIDIQHEEIADLIAQHEDEIQKLEEELSKNLTNSGFDKDKALAEIEEHKREIAFYQEMTEEATIVENISDGAIDPNVDMRLYHDLQKEIEIVEAQIGLISDQLFEINPSFETGNKWADSDQLELCATKTEVIIDYFGSKRSTASMRHLEDIADNMESALADIYHSHLNEAKIAQESGDITSAIEHLKEARDIKDEFPFIDIKIPSIEPSNPPQDPDPAAESSQINLNVSSREETAQDEPDTKTEPLEEQEMDAPVALEGNLGDLLLDPDQIEECKNDPEKSKIFKETPTSLFERIKELYFDVADQVEYMTGHTVNQLYLLVSSKFPSLGFNPESYPEGITDLRRALFSHETVTEICGLNKSGVIDYLEGINDYTGLTTDGEQKLTKEEKLREIYRRYNKTAEEILEASEELLSFDVYDAKALRISTLLRGIFNEEDSAEEKILDEQKVDESESNDTTVRPGIFGRIFGRKK